MQIDDLNDFHSAQGEPQNSGDEINDSPEGNIYSQQVNYIFNYSLRGKKLKKNGKINCHILHNKIIFIIVTKLQFHSILEIQDEQEEEGEKKDEDSPYQDLPQGKVELNYTFRLHRQYSKIRKRF